MKGSLRSLLGGAVIIGIAVGLMACGGKSSSNGDNSGSGSSADSGATSADLRLVAAEPLTLDPGIAADATSASYISEIFSGLVTIDKDLKIQPDLAESWDISPDGTVYTFHINKNAKFQDGRPVTADDFKYSMERVASLGASGQSTTADAYLGDIVGARDAINRCGGNQSTCTISGIKVIDSSTLQITIDGPKPYFLAKLTFPTAFVVDKSQVTANPRNWSKKPNATGPFKLDRWDLGTRIILTANDNYVGGAPALKRVLFNLSGGSSLTQYENGEIDASDVGVNDIERVQSSRDPLNKDYVFGDDLDISYIGFSVKQAPFDDPLVRKAFAEAIDKQTMAHVIYKDMLPVANSIMMPGLPGYNPDAMGPQFNVDQAKADLAASKYKDAKGLGTITLTEIGGGATASFDTQNIVDQLKQNLGVDVQISQSEQAAFFDDLDNGKLQMFSIGWVMDYPDPEDIIDLLFYSKSKQNNTGYSNPQVDDLVVAARTEQDVTKRLQDYQQAEQIILNDAPWIPIFFGREHMVVKPYVKGYGPSPIVYPILKYVSIQR